jgi:hypothetical protein
MLGSAAPAAGVTVGSGAAAGQATHRCGVTVHPGGRVRVVKYPLSAPVLTGPPHTGALTQASEHPVKDPDP